MNVNGTGNSYKRAPQEGAVNPSLGNVLISGNTQAGNQTGTQVEGEVIQWNLPGGIPGIIANKLPSADDIARMRAVCPFFKEEINNSALSSKKLLRQQVENGGKLEDLIKTPTPKEKENFKLFIASGALSKGEYIIEEPSNEQQKQLNSILQDAAKAGNNGHVLPAIALGANIDGASNFGTTALHLAVSGGHAGTVKLLLDAGANGNTVLHKAAVIGHIEVVKALIAKGADVNLANVGEVTALHLAASSGRAGIVELLLDAGAHVNLRDNDGDTALYKAVERGHTEVVKALIAQGTDVSLGDENGNTALQWATEGGHIQIAKALIKAGADVNQANQYGATALQLAASKGHTEFVQFLRENGANVDHVDSNGKTALNYAIERGNTGIIDILEKVTQPVQRSQ